MCSCRACSASEASLLATMSCIQRPGRTQLHLAAPLGLSLRQKTHGDFAITSSMEWWVAPHSSPSNPDMPRTWAWVLSACAAPGLACGREVKIGVFESGTGEGQSATAGSAPGRAQVYHPSLGFSPSVFSCCRTGTNKACDIAQQA